MKIVKTLILSLLFLLFSLQTAIAQEFSAFTSSLHITVTVNEGGQTRIEHRIRLTNNTPTTFISQYGLKMSSSDLTNISVTSNGVRIDPEVVVQQSSDNNRTGETSIGVTFPDKLVGEGKVRDLLVSFNHPDSAAISGSVLELSLAKLANSENYQDYSVTLITPFRYGFPTRTTPENSSSRIVDNRIVTTFSNLQGQSVLALFGSTQLFDLDIQYHLENNTNNTGVTQIALPPDTTYQKLHYYSIDPPPKELSTDDDGNWIATYQLTPNSVTRVTLSATAQLSLEPVTGFPQQRPSSALLKEREFWPINHSKIKELSENYSTPATIYQYVVDNLSYSNKRALAGPNRLGAIKVLNQPNQAVCQEFTDLFITMARANDIPSRRITGYAYTQNSELRPLSLVEDILHAWPEYYDEQKNRWIPVDPTWENTTGGVDYFNQFDLNHIVFAINGSSSSLPYPAGSYKEVDQNTKDVVVSFSTDSFPQIESSLTTKLESDTILGLPIPGFYTLKITNDTGQAWYNVPLSVTTSNFIASLTFNKNVVSNQKINVILPFQTISIPLQIISNSWLLQEKTEIQLAVNDLSNSSTEQEVIAGPKIITLQQKPLLLAGVVFFLIFTPLIAGSLLVSWRKKRNSLRR